MTRYMLGRKFRAQYGLDLTEYFSRRQVAYLKRLLAFTRLRIYVIAERAGFNNDRTMRRTFRRYTGMSPKKYRKARRGTKKRR